MTEPQWASLPVLTVIQDGFSEAWLGVERTRHFQGLQGVALDPLGEHM